MNPLARLASEIAVALNGNDDDKLADLCRQFADTHAASKRPTLMDLNPIGWDACGREVEEQV
jgi:hypothetical protein